MRERAEEGQKDRKRRWGREESGWEDGPKERQEIHIN